MFEEALLQRIIDAWMADQNHSARGRRQTPAPDIRDVRSMLEIAFLASLEEEEGQSITFNIALLPQDDIAGEQRYGGRERMTMTFDQSLPLTVESMIKLAPAFDPETTSFVIAPTDSARTEHRIWGVIFLKSRTDRFEEIPADLDQYHLSRPDTMIVHAVSRGSLMIARGNAQIGRFVRGDFVRSLPTPFTSSAMGSYIINAIQEDGDYKKHQGRYWQVYRDTLGRLIATVSAQGHGGAIILIPSVKVKEAEQFFSMKYVFRENLHLKTLLLKLSPITDDRDRISQVAFNQSYAQRIDNLARLACIDGALIITDDLEVVSFGATLMAPKWKGSIVVGPDGFGGGGEPFDISKLGTRHHSAIDFVGACPESIAFVISRDGPIMGLANKDERTVLCWRDMRVSVFAS